MTQEFKIKLAAIAKDEAYYLPLWVYHHLHFGFDVLDIRINNNTDNSIEILEYLKSIYGERLQYSFADKELAESRQLDVNFQTYIYQKILDETLKQDFTHLMFIDIDEYWCSKNFTDTVKVCLKKMPRFDVCMFQWMMESPDAKRQIDDFTFTSTMCFYKNVHVKSMARLSSTITAVRAHNQIVPKGSYILPTKEEVKFDSTDNNRGTVPEAVFQAGRRTVDDYFVYHNIFRSQDEYISSLLRGNKIDGEDSLLKANRFGFIPSELAEFKLEWNIDQSVLAKYRQEYESLVASFQTELAQAKHLVLERKAAVLDYLAGDHFLQQVHATKMLGISPIIYAAKKPSYFIKAKVDNLAFDEKSLLCSFNCEIASTDNHYELMLTHSTNKVPLAASINLLSTQLVEARWIRQYTCALPISELSHLVYRRQPPFCLVAKLTGTNEWILLERGRFRELAQKLVPHATRYRKKQREQANKITKPVNESIAASNSVAPIGFWRRLFSKVAGG